MASSITPFFRSYGKESSDWSTQEIAEFYRVEASLIQAGISVSAERGLTDEGDPWFVFCRSNDGDVILHFARIDGSYLIVSEASGQSFCGRDFRQLLKRFIDENPRLVPLRSLSNSKLVLHPAALLAAAVAAALFQMPGSEAIASELNHNAVDKSSFSGQAKAVGAREIGNRAEYSTDQHIAAAIAAIIGLSAFEQLTPQSVDVANLSQTLLDVSQDFFGTSRSVSTEALPLLVDLDKQAVSSNALANNVIFSNSGSALGAEIASHDQIGSLSVARSSQYQGLEKFAADTGVQTMGDAPHGRTPQPFDAIDVGTSDAIDRLYIDRSLPQAPTSAAVWSSPKVVRDVAHQSSSILEQNSGSDISALSVPQLAFQTVTNDLAAAGRTAPSTTLRSDISVHDIISFAATNAFGADGSHGILDVLDQATRSSYGADRSNANGQSPLLQSLAENSANRTDIAVALSQTVHVQSFDATADAIVNAFVRENNFEVLNSDRNVVLFDLDSSHYSGPDFVVRTWTMNDGSTISIVGHLAQQDLIHLA